MLRLLGRNVAVERSIVLRTHWSNTKCNIDTLVLYPNTSFARFVTTPSAQKTANQTDTSHPLPSQTRKQKIDLKPAPIKASSLPPSFHSTTNPTKSTPLPHSSKPKPSPVAVKADTTPPPGASVIELAKYDIALATAQGVLEAPPKDASSFKRFTHQAIQLLKFYFRGLKAINTHRKQTAAIHARVRSGGPAISRAEARFIRTYKQDALKLVPFTFLLLTLEELIPLVALYAPRMLPSTCSLPAQHDRIRVAARERQLDVWKQAGNGELFIRAIQKAEGSQTEVVSIGQNGIVNAMCGLLGLPQWGPSSLSMWRLRRHLRYLSMDDALLHKEGLGKDLTMPELSDALYERGILTQTLTREDMEVRLKWWLTFCEGEHRDEATDAVTRRILAVALVGARRSW
ncbi:hypothetical protein SERLA73DRAFT_179627 [Serpula lacrymans var. lacrymans S7.3]|uniref:Letm1 RBD domain-containing protein n=2 Tax=Serpula lacrymans var. lacrymans TaxID=341189 RepID=F8PVV2_SERL3|nr:uncharacterized protein SERLADRAFT_464816 [Serpula lacrymans var. lacrymans S7.9]EGN99548.1 hypothetical protein SERLA73DRAFT_179627 [Serpula lacrymans var. lacrymans S7.3]EGO25119.1 hypothetical protein SERLADRAFT_464816 [Serpula lacrymans var. lacrymans S7.9]